ncbi:MAG: AAA family ATPase [Pseudomonadota bacterium]|nr:AAA family ATPase [Pseudomonadota bacterium]
MTLPLGNAAAHAAFATAMKSGALHHAWLFAGPEGVGKGTFARIAALRLLAEGAARAPLPPGFDVPADNYTRSLIAAGSHPDYRELARAPKDPDKPGQDLARSIPIAQVRALQPLFAVTPSMSSRRVVLIDAIDDLERAGANALLKNLEEPPQGTVFLLISHAPGRLLPTIRSRCRALRFDSLDEKTMGQVLRMRQPTAPDTEIAALMAAGHGSPGRALGFAGLDMAALDRAMVAIARDGDPSNAQRAKLAKALAPKAAQTRYEAFLDRAPAFIAAAAPGRQGQALRTALDSYDAARSLAASARGLSLDAQATVFEMAGLVATLAPHA